MARRMLIDAAHPEETRVVVVSGTRLDEFDLESATKIQLKGNIYLAKVTRVEPSLQAAFVDYGGERHGFLAFNDIHPDYYQIPVADREALLAQEAAAAAAEEEAEQDEGPAPAKDDPNDQSGDDDDDESTEALEHDAAATEGDEDSDDDDDAPAANSSVEDVGGDDLEEVERLRKRVLQRRYKIQEVIKRRQILLVQVVKEERGNKGAALTTYLSLAGRYCVLMPNSTRGGGISRKITVAADRKRLKSMIGDLGLTDGMRLIVRTAGLARSKAEIKRDYEYLLRHWTSVRETTLESTAPALIYAEADLIKRSVRDLYTKDIDEVLVEGEAGYRIAKDFMRMLVPSHAKRVQPYADSIPLFHRYQVEQQFDSMYSPTVQLKSGGYVVINPTEALVAIDVNSGRATKERNIEETAHKTNLEAADEIARQLRLRDLAGLIVIDYIDMDQNRNNRSVERRLKEALKTDRARIQVGRISAFGLMEMSRQRLRPSLLEASSETCPSCGGSGVIRSIESSALRVLRAIEEEGIRGTSGEIIIHVATPIALYLFNQKRDTLVALEQRFEMRVNLFGDDTLVPPDYRLERLQSRPATGGETEAQATVDEAIAANDDESESEAENEANGDGSRRRRRRGKRGGRRRRRKDESVEAAEGTPEEKPDATEEPEEAVAVAVAVAVAAAAEPATEAETGDSEDEETAKKPRRRRRPRRHKSAEPEATETAEAGPESDPEPEPVADPEPELEPVAPAEPLAAEPEVVAPEPLPLWQPEAAVQTAAAQSELAALDVPVPTSDPVVALATTAATAEDGDGDGNEDEAEAEPTSKKTGWWRR